MEELRLSQTNGEKPRKIRANKDSSFEINEYEQHLVHVYLEHEKWDRGKKTSKGYIKKFYPTDFDRMSRTEYQKGGPRPENAFGHYDVVNVVHDPRLSEKSSTIKKDEDKEDKKLTEMSIEELREIYAQKFGVEPEEERTSIQLISDIANPE